MERGILERLVNQVWLMVGLCLEPPATAYLDTTREITGYSKLAYLAGEMMPEGLCRKCRTANVILCTMSATQHAPWRVNSLSSNVHCETIMSTSDPFRVSESSLESPP